MIWNYISLAFIYIFMSQIRGANVPPTLYVYIYTELEASIKLLVPLRVPPLLLLLASFINSVELDVK